MGPEECEREVTTPDLPREAAEHLGPYYVYVLVDPTDESVFYVGEGSKQRLLAHGREAVPRRWDSRAYRPPMIVLPVPGSSPRRNRSIGCGSIHWYTAWCWCGYGVNCDAIIDGVRSGVGFGPFDETPASQLLDPRLDRLPADPRFE